MNTFLAINFIMLTKQYAQYCSQREIVRKNPQNAFDPVNQIKNSEMK